MTTLSDVECMSLAIRLAKRGLYTTRSNPNVGCVVTDADGNIAGTGFHELFGQPHAEINALQVAGEKARGGTVYVTLEPCCHQGKTAPCTQALITAGVSKVVIAMQDPNPLVAGKGIAELRTHGIEVESGLLAAQAALVNRGFIKRMSSAMPWVTVKVATSLDGAIALDNGQSQWITSEQARKDVHHLRARHDAIMTGIGTVMADDPSLNVRLNEDIPVSMPLRVVIDSKLKMPASAKMLTLEGKTLIFTAVTATESDLADNPHCEIIQLESLNNNENDHLCLRSVLAELAKRGVNSVMVEAGSSLVGALIRQQLVDELITYIAPKLMGDASKGSINLGVIEDMRDCPGLEFTDIRNVGEDLRITSKINYEI